MGTQKDRNLVNSLLSVVVEYIVNNLSIYEKSDLESIEILPANVKNILLKKFTSTSYFSRNVPFTKFLKAFVNKNTAQINLTSVLVTDEMLDILHSCQNLKEMYLTRDGGYCKISSEGLINLLQNTPKIENFIIMRSDVVNDEVLKCISKCCPHLHGLDIGGCVNVTDIGLGHLKEMQIKWLRISRTQITDDGIIELVQGKCGRTLVELMIDNCVNVTNVGLNSITQCCPNLTILNFLNCNTDILTNDVFTSQQHLKQLFWQIPF